MSYLNGGAPAMQIKGIWAGYNHIPALQDINLQVSQGEILGLIGPNGSGKSTLFKVILGIVKPWRGEVSIFGHPNRSQRTLVGYMPQMETVDWDFPVTVRDVALMGRYGMLGLLRRPRREDRMAADAALERVGMDNMHKRLIGELSGGQRRRVLLARALSHSPKLLLLDEPLAGLDTPAQEQLMDIVRSLPEEGTSVVMSTHDLCCISGACHNAACLNRSLVAYGTPDEVLTEDVLNEAFGTKLLMVNVEGQTYAYQRQQA